MVDLGNTNIPRPSVCTHKKSLTTECVYFDHSLGVFGGSRYRFVWDMSWDFMEFHRRCPSSLPQLAYISRLTVGIMVKSNLLCIHISIYIVSWVNINQHNWGAPACNNLSPWRKSDDPSTITTSLPKSVFGIQRIEHWKIC